MLEVVVGLAAAVLVCAGIVIALGPALPRRVRAFRLLLRRLLDQRATPARLQPHDLGQSGLHPTTQRAMHTASRMATLLQANGLAGQAADLRAAARQVAVHETEGLRALRRVDLELQQVRLEDEGAYLRFRQLQRELRQHVGDRAEQLEILFR